VRAVEQPLHIHLHLLVAKEVKSLVVVLMAVEMDFERMYR
jgi:hypothetical protein